jgi:hypothetical protein
MLDAEQKASFFQRPPSDLALRADPFAYVDYDHSTQSALADLLENLADSLPDCVNRAAAALAAGQLRSAPHRHALIEETALFPAIEACCARRDMSRAMEAARREHEETAGDAIELAEALDALAEQGCAENPESLGFMLRAYFEGVRRHLRWVEAAIVEPARRNMDGDAVSDFSRRLGETLAQTGEAGPAGLTVIDGDKSRPCALRKV